MKQIKVPKKQGCYCSDKVVQIGYYQTGVQPTKRRYYTLRKVL